ncbi:hypothetical protein pneo_cds_541 [Pandoravirus neocaledonia]|uniref:Uncharacterized protein n=1 Tax=Pandoravirus neocaledonia TaxID=2107708 RepID=A0A2U7UCF6_9VIRU|nr:hypothetical protein pneo_cds_541 [Pandoravirus neocaledonia]AVK76148.1 hypothetical protein pneo_cds_541 [Pandoravirus neocaledonia]
MSALLYDRSNPTAVASDAYASSAQQGGLYAIALAPDAGAPQGATVEFPYRLVADLGRVRYYALDPSAARDPDEAAFLRAYAAEPGVTARFVANAYTLAVEARAAPDGTTRLVARPHPAGASPDGRFYISASTDVDTVRRIGDATSRPTALAPPATAIAPIAASAATSAVQEAPRQVLTLEQLRQADTAAKAQRVPEWIRARQSGLGRGRITGGRADVGGVGGVRVQRAESEVEPPQGPEALGLYKRQRARQLARSVLWVQNRQQRQAQLAAEALDEARARASQEARARAQAEVEAQGIAATMAPTRLAARLRHRQAEIAQDLVGQAAIDAIQREATARAQADTEAAIAEQVEREVAAGLFHAVPGGPVGGTATLRSASSRRRLQGGTAVSSQTTIQPPVLAPPAVVPPPQINVQPQPPTTAGTVQAGAGARNRRHSNAAVRAEAMSVFQDTVAQRLSHLPDDSPVIRDIIAEWSAATKSNPAGLTGAMARERAIQWWASQRWADAHPAERARHAEEAKARADSDAVAMAEAAVRRRIEEATVEAVEPATSAAAAARSRRRRAEQRSEEALLPEPQQALLEARRMAEAPPAKRARRAPVAATGPPPLAVRTATGQLVEVPRPALASVPVPVTSTASTTVTATMGSVQPAAALGASASRASLPVGLGVSRSSVAGGGFLGRAPAAPSPVETVMAAADIARPLAGGTAAPSSSIGDVAARLRQLGLAQARRAALIQRQTGLQWSQGM